MRSCYKSGHKSVLEFAQFHFHIEGVSRSLLAQLTRHRTASFAVRSQRYCIEDKAINIMPPSILGNDEASQVFIDCMQNIQDTYSQLMNMGIPNEDARFVLSNACGTTLDMTIDFRNLCHFMNERLCAHAQWEIQMLALLMRVEVVNVFPESESMLVPKCESFPVPMCPEQRKPCGKHITARKVQAILDQYFEKEREEKQHE